MFHCSPMTKGLSPCLVSKLQTSFCTGFTCQFLKRSYFQRQRKSLILKPVCNYYYLLLLLLLFIHITEGISISLLNWCKIETNTQTHTFIHSSAKLCSVLMSFHGQASNSIRALPAILFVEARAYILHNEEDIKTVTLMRGEHTNSTHALSSRLRNQMLNQ